jgi:hypothetical protein
MSCDRNRLQDIERPVQELHAAEAGAIPGGMTVHIEQVNTEVSTTDDSTFSLAYFSRLVSIVSRSL